MYRNAAGSRSTLVSLVALVLAVLMTGCGNTPQATPQGELLIETDQGYAMLNADAKLVELYRQQDDHDFVTPNEGFSELSYFAESDGNSILTIANIDGTDPDQLLVLEDTWQPTGRAAWAPDGSHLAFPVDVSTGSGSVVIVDRQQPNDPVVVDVPADVLTWSPDGSQLAARSPSGALQVISLDGTVDETEFALNPEYFLSETRLSPIAWSPQGDEIAVTDLGRFGLTSVATANIESGKIQTLVSSNPPRSADAWESVGNSPLGIPATEADGILQYELQAWLPDGNVVVEGSSVVEKVERTIVVADDETSTAVSDRDVDSSNPVASSDGTYLAFVIDADDDERGEISYVELNDPGNVKSFSVEGTPIAWRP